MVSVRSYLAPHGQVTMVRMLSLACWQTGRSEKAPDAATPRHNPIGRLVSIRIATLRPGGPRLLTGWVWTTPRSARRH